MLALRSLFTFRGLAFLDVALSVAILALIPYTEIDWSAYMQEVEGFLEGETNYLNLKGDTGPLVYPGVFVYFYAALYYLTARGTMVWLAQWLFTAMYLCTTVVVFHLYGLSGRVPMVYSIMTILSRRVHSIFILRLFNDGVAMLLLYTSVVCTAWRDWKQGAMWYSLAVGVKMNVLLFAPGLLAVWLHHLPVWRVLVCIGICAAIQVAAGLPFLSHYPVSYLVKAFELSRVFTYKWTVNYKFISESTFASPTLGAVLLLLTLGSWIFLAVFRWRKRNMNHPRAIIQTLFESNLCGVVFSRTMHYQFYIWFFHQVPLLLYMLYSSSNNGCVESSRSTNRVRTLPLWVAAASLVIVGCIDYGFTVYPSTPLSSCVLMCALGAVWLCIMTARDAK